MELYEHATRLFADRLGQTDIENEVRLLEKKEKIPSCCGVTPPRNTRKKK